MLPSYQESPAQLAYRASEARLAIFKAICAAGKGHIGGAFSCIDVITSVYFGAGLTFDEGNAKSTAFDRFILSKGHASLALYTTLAALGCIETNELDTVCRGGARLGEHPDHLTPGVDALSGSLGHGLAIGVGMALAQKMDGSNKKTFVLMGDGECQEGSVWEAATKAPNLGLGNLVTIIDANNQITLDKTEDMYQVDNLGAAYQALGWEVIYVDGHSHEALQQTLIGLNVSSKPKLIVARTIKGKGVSFMEGQLKWHHGMPSEHERQMAQQELVSQMMALKEAAAC